MVSLRDTFHDIADAYYRDSDDYKALETILAELDSLLRTGGCPTV